jgi:hypothetical protein
MNFSLLVKLKQVLLAIPIVYFYLVAFALEGRKIPEALIRPIIFLIFGILFFLGLSVSMILNFYFSLYWYLLFLYFDINLLKIVS